MNDESITTPCETCETLKNEVEALKIKLRGVQVDRMQVIRVLKAWRNYDVYEGDSEDDLAMQYFKELAEHDSQLDARSVS